MPLFKVSVDIEMEMVVQAPDEDEAWDIARNDWRDSMRDSDVSPHVYVTGEIKRLKDLPSDWDAICLPYGGDGKTRIQDILDNEP